MTTQDLINTLRQGKPMTDRLMREIVRELEEKVALRGVVKKYLSAEDELLGEQWSEASHRQLQAAYDETRSEVDRLVAEEASR